MAGSHAEMINNDQDHSSEEDQGRELRRRLDKKTQKTSGLT